MSNPLQLAGAQALRSSHYAPLWTGRFATGLWTQRSPLRDAASTRMEEKFYGPRGDAFIDGSNIELSNRLTPIRRPGHSVYNTQSFNAVDFFYELRLFNSTTEQIKVLADQADGLYNATGASIKSILWTKSAGAGQTYLQSVANVLFFGNGVDQKKLQNSLLTWAANTTLPINATQTFLIDPSGNMQQLYEVFATVTHVTVVSNVLTITCSASVASTLAIDLSMTFSGLTTATWLNGLTVTITAVSTNTFTATFTNNFTHADTSVADSGKTIALAGGTATTGGTTPTWNNTLLGKTYDGTIVWVNRGNPTENWGIVAPTVKPTVVHGGQNDSWQPNTFYANDPVVIDTNGNLQKVTTAGKTGATTPAWGVTVGSTTTDGTVVWTMIQTAASLVWAANTAYATGHFLIGTASGTACLFKLEGFTGVKTTGAINAYQYNSPHSGAVGAVVLTFPTTTGSAIATASGNSFIFNPPARANSKPVVWATLNGAGATTGYTTPFPATTENYCLVLLGSLEIPAPGQYTFTLKHQDGLIWGIGGAEMVSGLINNPIGQTGTPVNNYTLFGCSNISGLNTDTVVVNFPAAGTYPIEVDWDYWYHSGQTLQITVNGNNIIPDPAESGATQPIWPAWSTSFAPSYPTVSESQGALTWTNIGPAADYTWYPLTSYVTSPDIIDPNNYIQNPYEAGKSGSTQPSFSTTFSGTTADNPNLLWINQGQASSPPTGTLTTVNGGWQYVISLVNTLDDTVSNAGPATAATGNFRASTGVAVSGGIPTNYDPQADYVAVFRTEDGGATYFLIPGPGNTPYTVPIQQYLASGYTDTTPDSGLNILLEAPTAGQNTPPQQGVINLTYHLGRIFVSLGNTVYWSTGPDTPIGNGTNGFLPTNFATFPSTVKRMVPTAIGLLVHTVSDIYLGTGSATSSNPLVFVPYLTGIGLLSYNALDINGSIIYFLTSDSQLVSLDPSAGVAEVGFPIGDRILNECDPSTSYVTWHVDGSRDKALFLSNGSTGWYRLCPTPAPEAGMMWSPFAAVVGGCKAVQSIEVTPGKHKLLVGPTGTGEILVRDWAVYTDNGTPYTAFGTIGSLVLAQPGQLAELSFLTTDASAIGSRPSMSVLIDEISGTFEAMPDNVPDPTQKNASTTLYMDRWYFSQTQQPAICRHMQIKFSWPAEAFANELLSLTLYGGYSVER